MNVELTINAGQARDKMKNEVLKYKESRQQLSHYGHQLEFVPKHRFCMNSRRNIAWHLRTAKKLLEWTTLQEAWHKWSPLKLFSK